MNKETLIHDIKQNRFILDQKKAKRREILNSLNIVQKEIKQQEEKIFNLVGMLERCEE